MISQQALARHHLVLLHYRRFPRLHICHSVLREPVAAKDSAVTYLLCWRLRPCPVTDLSCVSLLGPGDSIRRSSSPDLLQSDNVINLFQII
jgi:hypothetical protein